jgi:hypothetical protein
VRYHVFIDGSRDPSPAGRQRLAHALGEKYGMAPATIAQRLSHGRFCAWASLDIDTARRLASELDALGASYTLVEDAPEVSAPNQARSTSLGLPPPPGRAAPSLSSSPLAAASRVDTSEEATVDLGVLRRRDGDDDEGWKLARLDGTEGTGESAVYKPHLLEGATRARPVSAPPPMPPASADPFAPPTVADPFAPPDMAREQEALLEVGDRPVAPGTVAAPVSAPLPTISTYRGAPAAGSETLHRDPFVTRVRTLMAESARARFAAGVAVAFLVGLVPAQVFASWRNGSAYDEIRSDLEAEYARADTPETWATLESARDDAHALVATRQQRVAVGALMVWLAFAAGVGFVWFRLVDWEGAVPRVAPAQESPAAAAAAARRRATR